MKEKCGTPREIQKGPQTTYEAFERLRAEHQDALTKAISSADRRYLKGAIASIDQIVKSSKAKRAERKRKAAPRLREIDTLTDRGRVMAQLARKIARGSDAIYHGTRHLDNVLRCGKLLPPLNGEPGIFLSRSPEAAAYFASLLQTQASGYSPGVLVLNRRSLTQSYRLEPSRYDEDSDQDEREEVVWNRIINVRRHLLGVVRDAEVTAILGSTKNRYLPPTFLRWSLSRRRAFNQKAVEAGDKLVRDGRARVREIIISERKKLSTTNARLSAARIAVPTRKGVGKK
jgi:hypothetical protein